LKTSILVAISNSLSSRTVVNFLGNLPFCKEDLNITLFHVFMKPSGGEAMMGEKFMQQEPEKYKAILKNAKDKLATFGFKPELIKIKLVTESYPTVAEGLIAQYNKGSYDMVIIGRKKMSKAEEFVLGDPSVKLLRALEGAAVLVVKSK